jgi:hypothetical protein
MFTSKRQKPLSKLVLTTLPLVAVLATGLSANAAENYKLRQSPLGSFGGDIATPADKPGFFGTASFTGMTIEGIKDATGKTLPAPALSGNVTGYPATYSIAAGKVNLMQEQTQLNVAAGYLTEGTYADGRIAFVANMPFVKQSRTASIIYPASVIAPSAYQAAGAVVDGQVNAGGIAQARLSTGDAVGIGDTEFSTVWVRHTGPLKVAAGVSVFAPTGKFSLASDTALLPNPGFGNFYTIRPGVAFTYNLNPNYSHQDWDAGVTVAGRIAYGVNTKNKDTNYKSGNFIYSEAAIVKVMGDAALGFNLSSTEQVTDDTCTGTCTKTIIGRYKNMAAGPFFSYKFPGQDMGINFQINRNFSGRNAIDVTSYQLRLIKAF